MVTKKRLAQMTDTQLFTHLQIQEAIGMKIQQLGEAVEMAQEKGDITKAQINERREPFLKLVDENSGVVASIEKELDSRAKKKLGVVHSNLDTFKSLYKYYIVDCIVETQRKKEKSGKKDESDKPKKSLKIER